MWTDKKGITHVSDQPPPKDVEIVEMIDSDEMIQKQLKKIPVRQVNKTPQVQSPIIKPSVPQASISRPSDLDCWVLGNKFGYCGTLAFHSVACRTEDDVVISAECRKNPETNLGIRSGTERTFDKFGLPKK